MRALPGTPVGGLFPPRLPSAIGEGQPRMAEQQTLLKFRCSDQGMGRNWEGNNTKCHELLPKSAQL